MKRAFAVIEIILVLALLGGGLWVAFPSIFSGASRRAATSTAATAKLETATTNKDATAAASVATMLSASSMLPETPVKSFLGQEGAVALSLLPPPDPAALVAAEQRKNAVLSGRLTEAERLYGLAAKTAADLRAERDAALADRRAADEALVVAAAAEHAKGVQLAAAGVVVVLALGAFVYVKLFHITPSTVGEALADIKAGEDPVKAFSSALAPRLHKRVHRARRMATDPDAP